jgi:putative chitinase
MPILTLEIMKERWPQGDQHVPGLLEGIVNSSDAVFTKYNVNQPLLIAHMMAQFSEECGQGLEMLENMNYSAERLRQVFPDHFTPTLAAKAAHNGRMIADIAYGGRMGNAPPPSDDGWNYRGHGLSQVTGREGVEDLEKFLTAHDVGWNVVDDPSLIIEPQYTLECGVADWLVCGCLPHAAKDDIVGETRALNGGLNGLAERERQLKIWKSVLKIS